jgi:hypothetical protein
MLSYKEYKQLNESLYNLGIRSPNVISEPIGKTGVDTLEEAKAKKKCDKMMKKGMEDEELEDEVEKDVEDSGKDEKPDDDVEKDIEDSEESEEGDEEEDAEHSDVEDKVMMMKKKMKKKSKKEWSEIESDLNDLIESIKNPEALLEVKKGLEIMKKGMKKCACSESQLSSEEKSWWDSVNSMIS